MESLDIKKIQALLLHRYPFLLVDKVLSFTPGETITAIKNVTINEPFFQGHFPTEPIMPGVLIVEAMAQVSGILAYMTMEKPANAGDTICVMTGIDKCLFKQPVYPGDQLTITSKLQHHRCGLWKFESIAHVDDSVAAKAIVKVAEKAKHA